MNTTPEDPTVASFVAEMFGVGIYFYTTPSPLWKYMPANSRVRYYVTVPDSSKELGFRVETIWDIRPDRHRDNKRAVIHEAKRLGLTVAQMPEFFEFLNAHYNLHS